MKQEVDALNKNETWILVPKPEDKKVTDNKWVYPIKTDSHGDVTHHKARLVAKGYT